jgi:hypothetical protein
LTRPTTGTLYVTTRKINNITLHALEISPLTTFHSLWLCTTIHHSLHFTHCVPPCVHHQLSNNINKTTRVWSLREQKHRQKSQECGFIFIPCHKNYRKTTYGINFWNFTRQVRYDVAMTLRRRRHDITSICPTIRMTSLRIPTTLTQQRKSALHILLLCCIWYFYTTARSPDSTTTGQILLFFYEIYGVTLQGRPCAYFDGIFLLRFCAKS